MSAAYYAAMNGAQVDYLSFEIPFEDMWFNIASLYSSDKDIKIPSSDLKERKTTEEQELAFRRYVNEIMDHMKSTGGYLNIVDQSSGSASTFTELCARLEAMAEERKRPADLIVIDNVDNLAILQDTERNELTKVNNYIIALDSFCKEYCNGTGTAILLLSQVNRPAMKKLSVTNEDTDRKAKIDVTCVQKYNALYEKATCVLVGCSNEVSRSRGNMKVYTVKLRNRQLQENPIIVSVDFKYSQVKGYLALQELCDKSEKGEEKKDRIIGGYIKTQTGEMSKEDEEALEDEFTSGLDEY